MPSVVVTATGHREAIPYVDAIESRNGHAKVITPKEYVSVEDSFLGASGLLLCGGYDLNPLLYGDVDESDVTEEIFPQRDEMEMDLLGYAIQSGMPILGICRGMQLINVAFGGKLIQDIPDHRTPGDFNDDNPLRHSVYVSPGSRLGAIIGAGAIYRVNSLHHQGLKEAQRAPSLLASAYSPFDGIIEGLESPEYPLLIGVQCHPERYSEVPKSFMKLFEWLVNWTEFNGRERLQE